MLTHNELNCPCPNCNRARVSKHLLTDGYPDVPKSRAYQDGSWLPVVNQETMTEYKKIAKQKYMDFLFM